MFWDFAAMVVAAFAVAGVILFLIRVLKVRLPKWTLPAVAGLTMIGYTIWSEYSWSDRMLRSFPADTRVVAEVEVSQPWRPWTYAVPLVTRMSVLIPSEVRAHDLAEGVYFLNLHGLARWEAQHVATVAVDCVNARGLELAPGQDFPVGAPVPELGWTGLAGDDPVLLAVCAGA